MQTLKVLSWNVHGLKRNIVDPDLLQYISHFDLIFLNETWVSKNDLTIFDIENYSCVQIPGNKYTTKGRTSGGISFYYKNSLKQFVQIIDKNHMGVIWVKLDRSLFSFNEDVYICHMYIPPRNSNVLQSYDFDFSESLESDILKYNDLGKVYGRHE